MHSERRDTGTRWTLRRGALDALEWPRPGDHGPASEHALSLYRKLLGDYPAHDAIDEVRFHRARLFQALGQSKAATREWVLLALESPNSRHRAEATSEALRVFLAAEQWAKAAELAAQALQTGPTNPPLERARNLLVVGMCQWEIEGRSPEVASALREAQALTQRIASPEAARIQALATTAIEQLATLPPRAPTAAPVSQRR